MATISLCMIVKNESENLGRCLTSVQNVVDEIIIVDTGSTDNTVAIAEQYGVKLLHFIWNDNFSDARNASLEAASGDWIIFLDADEQLVATSETLRKITSNSTYEGYFFKIVNVLGSETAPEYCPDIVFRMFRNKREYRFTGAIHEQIVHAIIENNPLARYAIADDANIYHYGYLDSHIKGKGKLDRNLSMIEIAIAKQPDNKLLQYHYGVELYRSERYEQAITALQTATQGLPSRTSYMPKLLRQIIMSLYKIKQYRQALDYVQQGTALYPNYADLYYFAGLCHFELADYSNSIKCFRQATALGDQPWHYASFAGLRGFRSYYLLGQLAELFCNEEEALQYYLRSLQDCPIFIAPLQQIIKILVQGEEPDCIGPSLNKICECCTPESNLLLGKILLIERYYSLAADYLNNAVEGGIHSDETYLLRAICFIQTGKYCDAQALLANISSTSPFFALKLLNLAFLRWLTDDYTIELPVELSGQYEHNVFFNTLTLLTNPDLNKSVHPQPEESEILLDVVIRGIEAEAWSKIEQLLAKIDSAWVNNHALAIAAAYARHNRFDDAEQIITLCQTNNSQNYETLMCLGLIKTKRQQYWEAARIYREAMALAPQIPKAYVYLLKIYQELQNRTLQQASQQDLSHNQAVLTGQEDPK